MASRVLYGMAAQGLAWSAFARVHPTTRTPHYATVVAVLWVLALALVFPLEILARITSFIALGIFATVNGALLALKRQRPSRAFSVPAAVPAVGFALCVAMMLYQAAQGLFRLAG